MHCRRGDVVDDRVKGQVIGAGAGLSSETPLQLMLKLKA